MHFTKLLVAVTASMIPVTQAFKCPVSQYGQCYFDHVNSDGNQQRCALKCSSGPVNVECHCPDTYPKNNKGWKYTGKHQCINLGQYNGRHKCHN